MRRSKYPQGLPTGDAVVTGGGQLPARYVIHTVGPIWGRHGNREAELLAACYSNSLKCAIELGISTVAFPSISTGAYAYPRELAAAVASKSIQEFLMREDQLSEVRLVFFSPGDARVFLNNHTFTS
ncbi:MAG: macro domain-containing protein [Pyrinomonadaceae bacterium]